MSQHTLFDPAPAVNESRACLTCGCRLRADNRSGYCDPHRPKVRPSPTRKCWDSMMDRCYRSSHPAYANYGGRGIRVCERWHSFDLFLADMGTRPSRDHSIDRHPDQNGNYEPGNVRWATMREQQRNKRSNHLLTCRGKTQCLAAWSEETGIPKTALRKRLLNGDTGEHVLRPVDVRKRTRGTKCGADYWRAEAAARRAKRAEARP